MRIAGNANTSLSQTGTRNSLLVNPPNARSELAGPRSLLSLSDVAEAYALMRSLDRNCPALRSVPVIDAFAHQKVSIKEEEK